MQDGSTSGPGRAFCRGPDRGLRWGDFLTQRYSEGRCPRAHEAVYGSLAESG